MAQRNEISENEKSLGAEGVINDFSSKKEQTKKKKIKKADILVFFICLVAACGIWMYASNLQKDAAENELNKEAIAEAVESGMNKTTETSEQT